MPRLVVDDVDSQPSTAHLELRDRLGRLLRSSCAGFAGTPAWPAPRDTSPSLSLVVARIDERTAVSARPRARSVQIRIVRDQASGAFDFEGGAKSISSTFGPRRLFARVQNASLSKGVVVKAPLSRPRCVLLQGVSACLHSISSDTLHSCCQPKTVVSFSSNHMNSLRPSSQPQRPRELP